MRADSCIAVAVAAPTSEEISGVYSTAQHGIDRVREAVRPVPIQRTSAAGHLSTFSSALMKKKMKPRVNWDRARRDFISIPPRFSMVGQDRWPWRGLRPCWMGATGAATSSPASRFSAGVGTEQRKQNTVAASNASPGMI